MHNNCEALYSSLILKHRIAPVGHALVVDVDHVLLEHEPRPPEHPGDHALAAGGAAWVECLQHYGAHTLSI